MRFKPEKLMLHPEVLQRFIRNPDSVFPVSLELSLTNKCNVSCVWCVDVEWRACNAGAELDKDVLLKNISILKSKGLTGVTIEGGGEPTAHPQFEEIVAGIREMEIDVGLITNGVKRAKHPEMFKWIRVSLDATNREEYKLMKRKDSFDDVMSNIEFYARTRHKVDNMIGIGYLLSTKTGSDIIKIVSSLKRVGCRYIQFRELTEHDDIKADRLPVDWSEVKKFEDAHFAVYNHQVFEESTSGNMGLPCYAHNLTTVIGASGEVDFCCRLRTQIGYDKIVIGNINQTPIDEILKGKAWRELSNAVLDKRYVCAFCPVCRHTKYNLMRHNVVNHGLADWAFL